MRKFLFLLLPVFLLCADPYYYKNGQKTYLQEEETSLAREIGDKEVRYFKNSRGTKLGVNSFFLVKLYPNIMIIDIENNYDVKFVKYLTKNISIFKANSPLDAIEISKRLVEDNFASGAQPDFIIKKERR